MRTRSTVVALGLVALAACTSETTSAPANSPAGSQQVAAAPEPDLVIRRRSTSGPTSAPTETTVYWSGEKRVTDDPSRRIVYDLPSKTATFIDKRRQAYFVMTFDHVVQQREKLNQRFENLPLEDRQKAGLDKAPMLKPTGKTEKIAGYEAKEHLVEGGAVAGSVWLTERIQPTPAWREHEHIIANLENTGYALRRLGEVIAASGGYPLNMALTLTIKGQQVNTLSEVIEVSARPIPPEMLVPPADFRKAEAPAG